MQKSHNHPLLLWLRRILPSLHTVLPAEKAETVHAKFLHNRRHATSFYKELAQKSGVLVDEVRNLGIWGNHSSTQFPDVYHATIGGSPADHVIGERPEHDDRGRPRR